MRFCSAIHSQTPNHWKIYVDRYNFFRLFQLLNRMTDKYFATIVET